MTSPGFGGNTPPGGYDYGFGPPDAGFPDRYGLPPLHPYLPDPRPPLPGSLRELEENILTHMKAL
jgi:hypothetical protein